MAEMSCKRNASILLQDIILFLVMELLLKIASSKQVGFFEVLQLNLIFFNYLCRN